MKCLISSCENQADVFMRNGAHEVGFCKPCLDLIINHLEKEMYGTRATGHPDEAVRVGETPPAEGKETADVKGASGS